MPKTLTGRHVLLIFLAFFITVTGVNALMVTFAIKTFSGEDVSGAYVKGLDYNQTLARDAAEARSGYAVAVTGSRRADGAVTITADVTENAAAASGITVTAHLRHPTNAHLDRDLELVPGGDGRFAASVAGVSAGHWDIETTVTRDGAELYQARNSLWLP